MLNLKEIAERINHPSSIQKDDITSFSELSKKYPYSQVFSMLYLKSLSDFQDVNFDHELYQHAFKIVDRKKLYALLHSSDSNPHQDIQIQKEEFIEEHTLSNQIEELINQNEVIELNPSEQLQEEKPIVSENLEVPIADITADISEIESLQETEIGLTAIDLIEENQAFDIEIIPEIDFEELSNLNSESILDEYIIEEDNSHSDSPTTVEQPIYDLGLIDEEIRSHISNQTFNLDYLLEAEIEHPSENNSQEEPEQISQLDVIDSEQMQHLEIEEESIPLSGKKSFMSWLKTTSSDQKDTTKDEIIEQVNPSEVVVNEEKTEPIIKEKEKKEFFSPAKKAKESIDESFMPVSETLAKIFEAQGNYPKAIFTYEQLILRIPEKKTFFANQIEKIKQKLNTQ